MTYLVNRFGIPEHVLEQYAYVEQSDSIWITTNPVTSLADRFDMETRGLRLLRDMPWGWKPTTYALQFFAEHITDNIIDVDQETLLTLLEKEPVPCERENGYVALQCQDMILGCGTVVDNELESRIPKGRGHELAAFLTADDE